MQVMALSLPDVLLLTPKVFSDERGFFFESYSKCVYDQLGIPVPFVQDNASFSKYGTIRALHYQSTPGQAKLISCVQGRIFDVAVDIRLQSPTFGKWLGVELNDQNHNQLFIPVGFAHGYCVISETALVHYKVSTPYNAKEERSLRWNDPTFNIDWPIRNPILSLRDQQSPYFSGEGV
jgi:dTDP-4-dehydrorhamnose 3,5-epimerase